MTGKAYQERRILGVNAALCAPAVAATMTEALEKREAGGLGNRSTEHAPILSLEVGSWEGVGLSYDPHPEVILSKAKNLSIGSSATD